MPTVAVNGTTLYYEARGDGVPMLFIHGIGVDSRSWADQIERLSPSFRCITYDRRGYRHSPLGEVLKNTIELHADDAAELISRLELAPCIVVGLSLGGRIAVDIVRRYPKLLRGAVFSDPALFALDPQEGVAFGAKLKSIIGEVVAAKGPWAAVEAAYEVIHPGLWARLPDAHRKVGPTNHVALLGELQTTLPYQVSREALAQIDRPCLVISGSESLPVFRNIANISAGAILRCKFVELADAGHVTYADRPAEFAAAVKAFAGTLGTSNN